MASRVKQVLQHLSGGNMYAGMVYNSYYYEICLRITQKPGRMSLSRRLIGPRVICVYDGLDNLTRVLVSSS